MQQSPETILTPPDETDALRADIYRLLAGLLRQAPAADLLDWLAALETDPADGDLAGHWATLAAAAAEATPEALGRAHFRHLVGVIEGEVIPYASWYRNGALMDEALLTLRRDLRVLGLERSAHTRDPEDHLAALLEVMALLIDERAPHEARFFLRHLAPWASRFFADLAVVDTPFYAGLGHLGRAFIDMEHERLAAEDGRDPVRLIEPDTAATASAVPPAPFHGH